jgi:hypothetical protein
MTSKITKMSDTDMTPEMKFLHYKDKEIMPLMYPKLISYAKKCPQSEWEMADVELLDHIVNDTFNERLLPQYTVTPLSNCLVKKNKEMSFFRPSGGRKKSRRSKSRRKQSRRRR